MLRACLPVLVLFVASSFVLAEDDAAARELYKKVSDALVAAKTLHVKDAKTAATDKGGMTFEMSSDVWLAADNQVAFQAKVKVGGEEQDMRAVSDGKTLALFEKGMERQRSEAPANVSALFRGALVAGGVMPAMSLMEDSAAFKDGGTSDFKPLAEGKVGDRAATIVEYTYHFSTGSDEVALGVKLYVDKETLAVLKREASDPKEGLNIAEEYAGFEVDAAVPDGTFAVPAGGEPEPEPEPEPPADEQPK